MRCYLSVENIWLVPRYGYVASAWASVAGYGLITLLSYIIGQKKYPVAYPLKDMAIYLVFAAVLYIIAEEVRMYSDAWRSIPY